MSTIQNKNLQSNAAQKMSAFDPFNTGLRLISFGNFLSTKNDFREVSYDSWILLDRFIASLPVGALTGIATHLSGAASKIDSLYHDKVAKIYEPLTSEQKTDCAMYSTYSLYLSNKVKKVMNPIDMLSMRAVNIGADTFNFAINEKAVIVQPIVNEKVVDTVSVTDALETGKKLIQQQNGSGEFEVNPRFTNFVTKVNNDEPVGNPVESVADGTVRVSGCPLRSILSSVHNGRIWGNANGLKGTVVFDSKTRVDFITGGGEMAYYLQETSSSAKVKVTIPHASKFIDIGNDVYDLNITNALNQSVRKIEHGDVIDDYRDVESKIKFSSFVNNVELKAYKGHFNFSWLDDIRKKIMEVDNRDLLKRLDVIILCSRYYYCTSGAVDWYIYCDLVNGADPLFNKNTIKHGPSVVKKIFGFWNMSRVMSPSGSFKTVESVSDYCKKFLYWQGIGEESYLYKFCMVSLSKLNGTYSACVTAKNLFKLKKIKKLDSDLMLGEVNMKDNKYEEFDPYAGYSLAKDKDKDNPSSNDIHIENDGNVQGPNLEVKKFEDFLGERGLLDKLVQDSQLSVEYLYDKSRTIILQVDGDSIDSAYFFDLFEDEKVALFYKTLNLMDSAAILVYLDYPQANEWISY